ncbi:MAG: hypothetical protein V4616_09440 [Bacteroidota bacterium]
MKRSIVLSAFCLLLAAASCKKENKSEVKGLPPAVETKDTVKTDTVQTDTIPRDTIERTARVGDSLYFNSTEFKEIAGGGLSNRPKYPIDLDKDGKPDLEFEVYGFSSNGGREHYVKMYSMDSTLQVVVFVDDSATYPKKMSLGDSLNGDNNWVNREGYRFASDSWSLGGGGKPRKYWYEQKGYVAVRKEFKPGKFKYGWLHIQVPDYSWVRILSWSFQN